MEGLWRVAPWVARALLLAVTVLFTLIGIRYLSDPVGKAAADEITLGSVMAISRLRVAMQATFCADGAGPREPANSTWYRYKSP